MSEEPKGKVTTDLESLEPIQAVDVRSVASNQPERVVYIVQEYPHSYESMRYADQPDPIHCRRALCGGAP